MQPRYTAEQWEQIKPALQGLAVGTVETARAVLVDGVAPAALQKETGKSKQLIHAAVKRVRALLDENEAQGLVPVMVWLPPELAEQVREMAAPYQPKKRK